VISQSVPGCHQVVKWFLSNGLMLNPNKTEAIMFGTGARLQTSASAMSRLTITGVDIPFVDSVRMLEQGIIWWFQSHQSSYLTGLSHAHIMYTC